MDVQVHVQYVNVTHTRFTIMMNGLTARDC